MTQSIEPNDSGPLNRVQPGMHVEDATGQDIGRVDAIRMGDPQAATTAGNTRRDEGVMDLVAGALGAESEPDVPEPLRSRLIRNGYIKLDSAGLLEADRYVPGEYVREVSADRVRLSVPKDALVRED